MAKADPIPVRFTEAQASALKRIAAACGVGEQDVARWAVEALSDYWRHHQDRLLLPLRFYETFSVTTIPTKPLILHEPAPRVRSELVRSEDEVKTRTPTRKANVRG